MIKMLRNCCLVLSAAVVVLGLYDVAFAQGDGCRENIKRDTRTQKVYDWGCSGTCQTPGNPPAACVAVAEPDGYGGTYATCQCPNPPVSGFWCIIGFKPIDPNDPNGEGQAHCIPKGTCTQCEYEDDIPTQDPEVMDCDCYCSG